MSHRSRIGMLCKDGSVQTIYLAANGYIGDAGLDLYKAYNSEERARKLIMGGGIRQVGRFFDYDEAEVHQNKCKLLCEDAGIEYIGDIYNYIRRPIAAGFSVENWNSLEEFYKSECFGFIYDFYLFKEGEWYLVEQLPQLKFKRGFENFRPGKVVLLKELLLPFLKGLKDGVL